MAEKEKTDHISLEAQLQHIAERGIQADRDRLLEDMVSQFPERLRWLTEYIVNGFDAGAQLVSVSGREDDRTYTIIVEDDGCGMSERAVRDWCVVFRSVKSDPEKAIGRHGLGKLTPAAVPGQCRLDMKTCTGSESCHLSAENLLAQRPILVEREDTPGLRGTSFEITFEKQGETNLRTELLRLIEVNEPYVRYLPLHTVVYVPDEHDPRQDRPCWLHRPWLDHDPSARVYRFNLNGDSFEAVLSLRGGARHELYQKRVLVSDSYDLLAHDLSIALTVPHLNIRVDFPTAELPFGRHRLCGEDTVSVLARHMREQVVPQFFAELVALYREGALTEVPPTVVEEIAIALIAYNPAENRLWSRLPVFAARNRPRQTLNEIRQIVKRGRTLLIERSTTPGVDYSAFDTPVLACDQPAGAVNVLQRLFKHALLDVSAEDAVLEASPGSGPRIGQRELRLQRALRFDPSAVRRSRRQKRNPSRDRERTCQLSTTDIELTAGVCEEALQATRDISTLRWRVNYLVQRDGRTPNRSRRFLVRGDSVILNLNHPEIASLVELAQVTPALAGHWALGLCFSEGDSILRHLTSEAVEDLMLMDAMSKLDVDEALLDEGPDDAATETNGYAEFERNANGDDFGVW